MSWPAPLSYCQTFEHTTALVDVHIDRSVRKRGLQVLSNPQAVLQRDLVPSCCKLRDGCVGLLTGRRVTVDRRHASVELNSIDPRYSSTPGIAAAKREPPTIG